MEYVSADNDGVVRAGDVPNTKAPVPVSPVTAAAKLAVVGVARKVATPVPRPDTPVEMGRPVQLVRVPEDGVPRTGVVSVGLSNVKALKWVTASRTLVPSHINSIDLPLGTLMPAPDGVFRVIANPPVVEFLKR